MSRNKDQWMSSLRVPPLCSRSSASPLKELVQCLVPQLLQLLPNLRAPKYIKQTLINLMGEINNNSIIVGGFNTTHSQLN